MNEEKIEYEYYTVDFDGVNSRYTLYDKLKEAVKKQPPKKLKSL